MNIKNLYMPVRVILPEFYGVFSTNADVNSPTGTVPVNVVGKFVWSLLNSKKTGSKQLLIPARERLKKLNDFIVNEQPIFH
jgi:hypothetical protein